MIGKTVGLQNIPAPSATVLNEALKLLSTFGDSKSLGSLLEKMHEAQEHNEQVFAETQTALAALSAERTELDKRAIAHESRVAQDNAAIGRLRDDLAKQEAKLRNARALFEQQQASALADVTEMQNKCAADSAAIQQREADCGAKESELAKKAADLEKSLTALKAREEQVAARERRLRAAWDGP